MECETYAPPLGYDIGAEGVAEMQKGFLSAMPRLCFLTEGIITSLRQCLLSEVAPFMTADSEYGFQRINVCWLYKWAIPLPLTRLLRHLRPHQSFLPLSRASSHVLISMNL